jgi:hypothetical protein
MNVCRIVAWLFLVGIQLSCIGEEDIIACNTFSTVDNARYAQFMVKVGDCAQTHSYTLQVDLTQVQAADFDSLKIILEGWPYPVVYTC